MSGGVVNMFAAKKVKLHGMKTSKWTTRDKIMQYKGLINLYQRDRKIIELDTNVSRKKVQRELKDRAKAVHADRLTLDNAIRGDKQNLRNLLCDHKELQLAYQNSQPKKVIEEIDQRNFNNRKVLDRLRHEKKKRSEELQELKLEKAQLEDRLKYRFLGQIREEKDAQIITGKVQDAILRKEAAYSINRIYKEILDIMKKDALYYDVILATVECDGYAQSKCFLGATKLGQLATEYLDDRRQEYDTLEKIILEDMSSRKTDIRVLKQQVETTSADVKQLLRKDSDMTTCAIRVADSASLQQLDKDMNDVEKTLRFLKNTMAVSAYEAIFPCLEEQLKQSRRLKKLEEKCQQNMEIMLNKTNHAQLMNTVLKTTVGEEVEIYRKWKVETCEEIEKLKNSKEQLQRKLKNRRTFAAKVRLRLQQLLQLSYFVKPREAIKSKTSQKSSAFPFYGAPAAEKPVKMEIPETEESDGTKIADIVNSKFSFLMSTYFEKYSGQASWDEAFRQVEQLMQDRMILASTQKPEVAEDSFLEQFAYTEANQQLTREDIKKQSAEIVAANTKNDDFMPVLATSRSARKFKS